MFGSDAVNKVDFLVFLRFFCEGRGFDCNDVDKVFSEMDIIVIIEVFFCVKKMLGI